MVTITTTTRSTPIETTFPSLTMDSTVGSGNPNNQNY